jgi:hypothetical protein
MGWKPIIGWEPVMGWKPMRDMGWEPMRDMGWEPMRNMDWEPMRNMDWELGRNMDWELGRNPPPRMPPRIWAELMAGTPSRATAPSTTESKTFLMVHLFSHLRTANGAVRTV